MVQQQEKKTLRVVVLEERSCDRFRHIFLLSCYGSEAAMLHVIVKS